MIRFSLVCVLLAVSFAMAASGAASTSESSARVAEPEGYWTGEVGAPVPATLTGGRVVRVKAVRSLLRAGGVVIVDVSNAPRRPDGLADGAPWMPVAHPALPGALWIPEAGDGVIAPRVEDYYRGRLAEATHGDVDKPLLVYCHERCWLSWNAAKRAMSYGYRRVYWFAEGIEGWTAAGQPTAAAQPQVPDDSALPKLVVLDLELTGDLGGPEFSAEHAARLKRESARLRDDLQRYGDYRVLDLNAAQSTIDELKAHQEYLHDCNGCDLDVGKQMNADLVMVAWVDRVSGLILSLTYEIHDVKTSQITARKSFDFRGDNDKAWNHAVDYMVRHMRAT
jgi:PQQ-dependent catabolism-associated CXXCW motif protein